MKIGKTRRIAAGVVAVIISFTLRGASSGNLLRDCIWLWGHDGESFRGTELGMRYGESHLDIPEACVRMGINNACVIRWKGKPTEPFEQYCEKLSNLKSFGWSVADGDTSLTFAQKADRVVELAKRFPKLTTVWLDGWFEVDSFRQPVSELKKLRTRLQALPQKPKLTVVFQSHEFNKNPKADLDACDQVSFWLWRASDIPRANQLFDRCRDLVGPDKPILLGISLLDTEKGEPLNAELMRQQLEFASSKLRSGELSGLVVHCSPIVDCDFESVRMMKTWIEQLPGGRLEAMNHDKLGVFIHWGLYSILGDGEWVMFKRQISKDAYNHLADVFRQPKEFSPREWVKLAKRAGARYCVFTTRHHDGFALWDTKTTDFNSVKTAAGRDYVREFCDACRAEGLRVGLYYSAMNWQYWNQRMPYEKSTWDEQVRVTVEGLRELMTNYGKIDYLWYDGCWGPGTADVSRMLELWPSVEMNAMARQLQPSILINDRMKLPEDFATPEQRLDPLPAGRAWESCITVNQVWGYRSWDDSWKSSEALLRSLLHCARFGGNLLINIGPRADGSVPVGCVRSLEGLGKFIAECPDSIYGSERDEWTEATHEAGVVTKANGSYWLWALNSTHLDGVADMQKVGPRAYRVSFRKDAKPCRWLGGRHDVVVRPGDAPVLGDDSAAGEPPNGNIVLMDAPNVTELTFDFPGGGKWKLEVGYVNADGFRDTLVEQCEVKTVGDKYTVQLPKGARGIYARRQTPVWKCRGPSAWQIAGMFLTEAMQKDFDVAYIQEMLNNSSVFKTVATAKFKSVPLDLNAKADHSDRCVSMTYCADRKCIGYSLARTTIRSDQDRTIYAAGSADWWWKLFVNGEEVIPFTEGSKPIAFPLKLKRGENEVLYVFHCGLGSHTFEFFDNH